MHSAIFNFILVMYRLGMSAPKSKLTYESFVLLFEEGRPEHYAPEQPDAYVPEVTNGHLSPDDAIEKLRTKVVTNKEIIQKVNCSLDLHVQHCINKNIEFNKLI